MGVKGVGVPWPPPGVTAERLAGHRVRFETRVQPQMPTEYREVRVWRKGGMRDLADDDAASLAVGLLDQMAGGNSGAGRDLLPSLCRRRLALDGTDVALMLDLAAEVAGWVQVGALAAVVSCLERLKASDQEALVDRVRAALEQIDRAEGPPTRRASVRARFARLLPAVTDMPSIGSFIQSVKTTDDWGVWATRRLAAPDARRARMTELMAHLAAPISGTVPAKKWLDRVETLLSEMPDRRRLVGELLEGAVNCPSDGTGWRVYQDNADVVRGLIWAAAKINTSWSLGALTGIIETNRPSRVVVDRKLLNAAYLALGYCATPEAISTLESLRNRTHDRGYLAAIDRALGGARPSLRVVK